MEDIDYENLSIPEEVAPYAKGIFALMREKEVSPKRKFVLTMTRVSSSRLQTT